MAFNFARGALLATGAIVCVASGSPAVAQTRSFDLPAQDATSGIAAFARQANVQIFAARRDTRGRRTNDVRGEMTVDQALARLLDGTGLTVRRTGEQTYTVVRAKPQSEAQADVTSANVESVDAGAVSEILVTGLRESLNADVRRSEDGTQPYVVFDRSEIERSGNETIEGFLRNRLTASTSAAPSNQTNSILGNTSSFNLRGLGTNQTLILVDGRRVAGATINGSPQQPDLNGIPLAAVERIEVLPTTASGIYGGSATGGVINVVLRRDYRGAEIRGYFEGPLDTDASTFGLNVTAGGSLNHNSTRWLFSASHSETNPLSVGERDFAARARAVQVANNPASIYNVAIPPLGATTNIRSTNGSNLVLDNGVDLGSPITFVPAGYSGASSDQGAALAANAGQYNLALANTAQGRRASLLSGSTVDSINLTLRQQVTSWLEAFVDGGWSRNESSFLTSQANSTFTIPASVSPFAQDITVTTPAFGADGFVTSKTSNLRVTGGVIARISRTWRSEADYVWQRARFSSSSPSGLTAAASTAAANGTLNILRDTNQFGADFAPFLAAPFTISPTDATLQSLSLRTGGPVLTLPGGPVSVTTLLEYRSNHYGDTIAGTSFYPSRTQRVFSAYGEFTIPFFSERNSIPGLAALELQLAGRWDNYRTNGASSTTVGSTAPIDRRINTANNINPTIGLRYQPIRDLTFRASYGTGYLPPDVNQLVPGPTQTINPFILTLLQLRDPKRGNEPLQPFTFTSGGNPDLRPERSRSYSLGAIFEPRFLSGFRLSVDWTRIEKTNNIVSFALNNASLANEDFVPGLIVRDTPTSGDPFGVGRIIEFNANRLFNIASLVVEATDFGLDYRFRTSVGQFGLSANATYLSKLQSRISPAQPTVENAGVVNALVNPGNNGGGLRWRGTGTVTWDNGPWSTAWTVTYLDSYWLNLTHTINPNQGTATVPHQIYNDVFVGYRFNAAQLEIRAGVRNIFNASPPVDLVGTFGFNTSGFSPYGDPRLRTFYLSVRKGI